MRRLAKGASRLGVVAGAALATTLAVTTSAPFTVSAAEPLPPRDCGFFATRNVTSPSSNTVKLDDPLAGLPAPVPDPLPIEDNWLAAFYAFVVASGVDSNGAVTCWLQRAHDADDPANAIDGTLVRCEGESPEVECAGWNAPTTFMYTDDDRLKFCALTEWRDVLNSTPRTDAFCMYEHKLRDCLRSSGSGTVIVSRTLGCVTALANDPVNGSLPGGDPTSHLPPVDPPDTDPITGHVYGDPRRYLETYLATCALGHCAWW